MASMSYYWRNTMSSMGKNKGFMTSTNTKMKAYGPRTHNNEQQNHQISKQSGVVKGEYVPVYVAIGLIACSLIFGAHTVNQHLKYDPSVRLKKKKRESFPEVLDPDGVVKEADGLINNSWFRKVAHVQEFDKQDVVPDPIRFRGDVYAARPRKAETLKSVGVDPSDE